MQPPKYHVGSRVQLGECFPAFQIGATAEVVHVYDFASEITGERMYEIRLDRSRGWLSVSESSIAPSDLPEFGMFGHGASFPGEVGW